MPFSFAKKRVKKLKTCFKKERKERERERERERRSN